MVKVLNRELVSVIAVVSLSVMSMSVLQPVLPLYITSMGISPSVMGLMFSLGMVGMVFGESTGGWLMDKIGVRIPMGIGTLFAFPVLLLFVFARNIPFIFILFLGWGIVRAGVFAPGRGYIGRSVPVTKKATYLAIYGASMSVSRSLGTFIGGLVGERLGYDWNFYIASGIALAGGLLVIFALSKIPLVNPAPAAPLSPQGNLASGKAPYRSKVFISQCIIAALTWVSFGVMGPFLPLLAVERVKITETEVGLLFTISALIGAGLSIPMGRLSDRKNKKTMMITGLLITAAAMAGIGYANSYGLLIIVLVVQSFGGAFFSPAAVALLSETMPQHWQGTAMGIYGGCEDAGVVVGSALGGIIWDNLGPEAAFLIIGTASCILAAAVTLLMLKYKPAPAAIPSLK